MARGGVAIQPPLRGGRQKRACALEPTTQDIEDIVKGRHRLALMEVRKEYTLIAFSFRADQ